MCKTGLHKSCKQAGNKTMAPEGARVTNTHNNGCMGSLAIDKSDLHNSRPLSNNLCNSCLAEGKIEHYSHIVSEQVRAWSCCIQAPLTHAILYRSGSSTFATHKTGLHKSCKQTSKQTSKRGANGARRRVSHQHSQRWMYGRLALS